MNVLLKSADPMGGDKYDENEAMNRRVETIETRQHGQIFARCVGDPSTL